VSGRIPLFLSFNESCEAVIILRKIRPTKEDGKFCFIYYTLFKDV